MKVILRIAIASAAVVALALPTLALGQGAAPKLSESPTSGFPDKAYILTLPSRQALTASKLEVTESGQDVSGLAVAPPGGSKSGAILLIDASNSMKGAPIKNAMAAARAFLAERKKDLPVAIVVFGPDDTVLSEFTTNSAQLSDAVAKTPVTSEGTHIYDALIKAASMAKDQGLERTTVVLLSDGTDVGSDASRAEALQTAADDHIRVISVGLSSPQYNAGDAQESREPHRGFVHRVRDVSRARTHLQGDRAAALTRVRDHVPIPASSPGERGRGREGRWPGARDGEVHDTRPELLAARNLRAELDRRGDHVAVADDLRDRLGSRSDRIRDLLRDRRSQPLSPPAHGPVRHGAERGGVADATHRGRVDPRRHRAAHRRQSALVAALRGGRGARRLQPLAARDRRLDDRRWHLLVDRRCRCVPVALGPPTSVLQRRS